MTATQRMRYQRRAQRAAEERRERAELIFGILTLLFALIAFAIAGTSDYEDEVRQISKWEERGITVARW